MLGIYHRIHGKLGKVDLVTSRLDVPSRYKNRAVSDLANSRDAASFMPTMLACTRFFPCNNLFTGNQRMSATLGSLSE